MGRQHRTLLRNLALALVALTIAFLGLTYYVRHRFPPREVARLLATFLTERTPFSVQIGSVRFNLLRGFEIDGISLVKGQRSPAAVPVDSVRIGRIVLHYKPLQLFHRRLHVQTVEIRNPHVWFTSAGASREHPLPTRRSAPAAVSQKPPPLDLDLSRLVVRDFGLTMRFAGARDTISVEIQNWQLQVDGAALQRGDTGLRLHQLSVGHPDGDLHVQLSGDTAEAALTVPLRFALTVTNSPLTDTARVKLTCECTDSRLHWRSPHRQIALENLPELLKLSAEGQFKAGIPAEQDSLNLSTEPGFFLSAVFPAVTLRLLGSSDFHGTAHLELKPSDQKLTLSLGSGSFPVETWLQVANKAVPEAAGILDLVEPAAGLSYLEFQGRGRQSPLETAALSLSGNFQAALLRHRSSQTTLDSVRSNFDLSASLSKPGIQNLDLHALVLANDAASQMGTRIVSLNGITLEVGATLDSTLWIHTADLDFQIDDALGGTAFVTSHWFTPGAHRSLRGKLRSVLQNLEVANLTDQPLHGRLDFQSTLRVPGDGSVHAVASWLADSLVLETPDQPIAFPALRGEFKGRGRFDPETRQMNLRDWQLWFPGFLLARGDLFAAPESALVLLQYFRTEPGRIVDWARPLLPETSADLTLGGTLSGHSVVRLSRFTSSLAGSLRVADGLFAEPSSEFAAGQIQFNGDFKGTLDSLQLCGLGRADSIWIGSFGRRPLTDTRFGVHASVFPALSLIRLDTVTASHQPLRLHALARGEICAANPDTEVVTLDYTFTMLADSFGPLGDVAQLRGTASGNGRVLMVGDRLHVKGMVQPRTLCARLPTGVELDTLAGCLHYDFWFDLTGEEPLFLSENSREFPNPLATVGYDAWRWLAPPADTLYIKRIHFRQYVLTSWRADIVAQNGFVYVPWFRVNAYGGAIGGRVLLDYRNRTSLTGAYSAEIQISRLNTALLTPRPEASASYITGTVRIRGEGFQPQSLNSVRGLVRFTELGPTVADDILASLDPRGTNPGIRNTRRLLALGFRPLQMSFQLRQGYFYPSLKLTQPWFSPIRLSGGRIDMGRLPLEPFLKMTPGS